MGFYGKVTNTSKAQFSFDKIYNNRLAMDSAANTDGVFVGRYVLVEYGNNETADQTGAYQNVHLDSLEDVVVGEKTYKTAKLYTALNDKEVSYIEPDEDSYKRKTIYRVLKSDETNSQGETLIFKTIMDDSKKEENEEVSYYWVVISENDTSYYTNYKIDIDEYGESRGFDSTVWTKVSSTGYVDVYSEAKEYTNGETYYIKNDSGKYELAENVTEENFEDETYYIKSSEKSTTFKYVMVAELNSVVPTLDIAADAPTLDPIVPHFDKNSTNVYYKMHVQPSWGFRVKRYAPEAEFNYTPKEEGAEEIKDCLNEINLDDDTATWSNSTEIYKENDTSLLSEPEFYKITATKENNNNIDENSMPVTFRSDASMFWKRTEYNKLTAQDEIYYYTNHDTLDPNLDPNDEEDLAMMSMPADIYYNKSGLNPDYIVMDDSQDEITIQPSGRSGHKYTNHEGITDYAEDIQELSMHLPSIGNAVAEAWNLVYGDKEANKEEDGYQIEDCYERIYLTKRDYSAFCHKLNSLWNNLLRKDTSLSGNDGLYRYYQLYSRAIGSNEIPTGVGKDAEFKDTDEYYQLICKYTRNKNVDWYDANDSELSYKEVKFRSKTEDSEDSNEKSNNLDVIWEDDYAINKYYIYEAATNTFSLSRSDYNSSTTYYKRINNGLRLVNRKKDGNGWTYDTKKIETIAGAINSVHDLMGMIIHDEEGYNNKEGEELAQALQEKINASDNDTIYYYSGNDVTYGFIDSNITTPIVDEEQLKKDGALVTQLEQGHYYRKGVGYVYDTTDNENYWEESWDPTNKDNAKKVDIVQYSKSDIYEKKIVKNYNETGLEQNVFYPTGDDNPVSGKVYYEIKNPSPIENLNNFDDNEYWNNREGDIYTILTEEDKDKLIPNKTYYTLDWEGEDNLYSNKGEYWLIVYYTTSNSSKKLIPAAIRSDSKYTLIDNDGSESTIYIKFYDKQIGDKINSEKSYLAHFSDKLKDAVNLYFGGYFRSIGTSEEIEVGTNEPVTVFKIGNSARIDLKDLSAKKCIYEITDFKQAEPEIDINQTYYAECYYPVAMANEKDFNEKKELYNLFTPDFKTKIEIDTEDTDYKAYKYFYDNGTIDDNNNSIYIFDTGAGVITTSDNIPLVVNKNHWVDDKTYYSVDFKEIDTSIAEWDDANGYYVKKYVKVAQPNEEEVGSYRVPKEFTKISEQEYVDTKNKIIREYVYSDKNPLENKIYLQNKYTVLEDNEYKLSTAERADNSKKYYYFGNSEDQEDSWDYNILNKQKLLDNFYVANKYYYNINGIWIKDSSSECQNRDYYLLQDYYVMFDDLNEYNKGSEWNINIHPAPNSVHLATRQEVATWVELKGFARNLNTIHGLILKINNLLEIDNTLTRDTTTVQGCVNKLQDIIARFDALIPTELMVVDSYGRLRSAPYITSQPDKVYNLGNKKEDMYRDETNDTYKNLNFNDTKYGEKHGRWIDLQVFNYSFLGDRFATYAQAKKILSDEKESRSRGLTIEYNAKDENNNYYTLYNIKDLNELEYNNLVTNGIYLLTDKAKKDNFNSYSRCGEIYNKDKKDSYWILLPRTDEELKKEFTEDEVWHRLIQDESSIKLVHNKISPQALKDVANDLNAKPEENSGFLKSTTVSDKNIVATNFKVYDELGLEGLNNDTDDILDLYTPIVDDMGHIIGHNTEAVTLPYGYKTIKVTPSEETNESIKDETASGDKAGETINLKQGTNTASIIADNTKDTIEVEAGNKWVRFTTNKADGKDMSSETQDGKKENKLTIEHEIHKIDVNKLYTDLNTDPSSNAIGSLNRAAETPDTTSGDTITVNDIAYDAAGHIIRNRPHTYTLPYGFKTVNVTPSESVPTITNNSDAGKTLNLVKGTNTQKVVANTAKDNITIEANNKWIRFETTGDGNDTNSSSHGDTDNKITIAHEVHSIDNRTLFTDINAKPSYNEIGDLSRSEEKPTETKGDTFTVNDIEFDAAGHITRSRPHTYTLPYGYKIFDTTTSGSTEGIEENDGTTTANNAQDKLTVAMGNKWLRSSVIDDKITIAHEVHWENQSTTSTSDLNGQETFATESYTFDHAGHVVNHNTHTYELPHGYSTFTTTNSTDIDDVSGNTTSVTADVTKDTFAINGENAWIQTKLSKDASGNDVLTIGHKYAQATVEAKGDASAQTPDYGATFLVPYIERDAAGHIKLMTDHTVTMPKQKIIDAVGAVANTPAQGTVVVKADHTTGNTLTFTHNQMMDVQLSNGNTETIAMVPIKNPELHSEHTSILSSDTLKQALAKIPTMISERIEDVLGASSPETLDTLTEIAAWINKNGAEIDNYVSLTQLEKDFYGLNSNGKVLSYNGNTSLQDRVEKLSNAVGLDTFGNGYSGSTSSNNYGTTVNDRLKNLETTVDTYCTDDLKNKVNEIQATLKTVQQTTGNLTSSIDGYMKYHVGTSAPVDENGNTLTNAMWIDTSDTSNILVKFPLISSLNSNGTAATVTWVAINTWQ